MAWRPGQACSYRLHASASLWCTDNTGLALWITLTAFLYQSFKTLLYCMLMNTIAGCSSAANVSMQCAGCNPVLIDIVLEYICRRFCPANKAVSPSQHFCLCNQPTPGLLCSTRLPTQGICAWFWRTLHVRFHFTIHWQNVLFMCSLTLWFHVTGVIVCMLQAVRTIFEYWMYLCSKIVWAVGDHYSLCHTFSHIGNHVLATLSNTYQ